MYISSPLLSASRTKIIIITSHWRGGSKKLLNVFLATGQETELIFHIVLGLVLFLFSFSPQLYAELLDNSRSHTFLEIISLRVGQRLLGRSIVDPIAHRLASSFRVYEFIDLSAFLISIGQARVQRERFRSPTSLTSSTRSPATPLTTSIISFS